MSETGKDRIAGLQERIRRAGRSTERLRTWLTLPAFLGPTIFLVAFLAEIRLSGRLIPLSALADAAHAWGAAPVGRAAMTACFFSMPVGAAYRVARRAQLRRRLAALSPAEQAAVLLPLREAAGDLRKIVRPLLRQLRVAAELTPADSPAGRGDEGTAAEQLA